ncbi:MAG: sulfite exporter TauE/SafE family protein [Desulfobacteraceae bacterium]|nr:MAG: sulfite exporter TauE/SafE family protein [Desulfobacteraceae bacterium]
MVKSNYFIKKDKPILIHLPALLFMSLFTGIAASAIGFTAWPLVVPVLFVLFGVDIYLTIFISLLMDCGNALVMTVIAARNGRVLVRQGLTLAAFALPWIFAGILIGKTFIPQNEDYFRGSAGYLIMLLGFIFIARGFKKSVPEPEDILTPRYRFRFVPLLAGVAVMAFQVGLVGIGGGMGYAVFLMLCISAPVLTATGTAMLMTLISTIVASVLIFFQIPDTGFNHEILRLGLPMMMAASMAGTAVGSKIAYSVSEAKLNFFIGAVVICAGLAAALHRFYIQ